MTTKTQEIAPVVAPQASTPAASNVVRPVAFKLAPLTDEQVEAAVDAIVDAAIDVEKAKRSLLSTVCKAAVAVADILKAANAPGLSSAQYDKQFRAPLEEAFVLKVAKKAITAGRAKVYATQSKMVLLAIVNNVATPLAGESLRDFYERTMVPLATAKLPSGEPIQKASKTGPKVTAKGAKASKPGAGPVGPATGGHVDAANTGGTGLDIRPALAAALILTKGNQGRAKRLVIVAERYGDQFDKWCGQVLTDAERKAINAEAPVVQPSEPVAPKPPVLGNVGEALVAAQRKVNTRASK